MKKTLTILLLALSLNAFAAPDSAYELGDDYKLTAQDKTQALAIVKKGLKDPYSAKFEGQVKLANQGKVKELVGKKSVDICVPVNAKNSYGAYTGLRYSLVVKYLDSGEMKVLFSDDVAQIICNK